MNRESLSAAAVASLSESQQNRLAQILDDYLVAAEQGTPITPAELLERHPDDAEHLRLYLSGLQIFHAAARVHTAVAPVASPPSGMRTIGEFQLIREIGRGGMGVVYEARQPSLRRRVALKILPVSESTDAKQITRFKNEAQAAAQVHHPNIVPVYAVGETEDFHYFAMQLIEGESLASLMRRALPESNRAADATTRGLATLTRSEHAAWPSVRVADSFEVISPLADDSKQDAFAVATIATYGLQAAEALHAAHEYGVIHRDVKPSNLLIDKQGKLWVADFGLARSRESASLTQTGDVCGTMRYMSPEQASGQGSLVDHRTDVYSLGVTLYELAARRHPLGDASDIRRIIHRSGFACTPLRHGAQWIPSDFETIVMKAIAEAREDRYATAQEMADDLRRFLAGEPILATPPTPVTRLRKWAVRHRRAVVAGACLIMCGLLAAAASFSYVAGYRAQAAHAAKESLETSRAMGRLLYDVPLRTAEQLAMIPGAEGVSRELLEQSLAYYGRLRELAFGDKTRVADLALAYSKIGGLNAVMGDRPQALRSHREAQQVLTELAAAHPDNAEYGRNLALCHNNAGLVLADLRRFDEALVELQTARRLQESWYSKRPDDEGLASELATTRGNLGLVFKNRGDADQAAHWFDEAITLQEKLLPKNRKDESLRRGLAASHNNLGAQLETTNPADAIRNYEQAIGLQMSLVRDHRWNQLYQAELARTYNNLGYVFAQVRDWPAAQRSYSATIRIQSQLVKNSPLAFEYQRELAMTYNNLGMALSEIGRLDEAAQVFEKSLAMHRPLLASRPHDAATISNMGGVYNNLGMLLEKRDRRGDADAAFRNAIDYQQRALDAEPGYAAARELLSRHYFNCARNLREQGKLADAQEISSLRDKLLAGVGAVKPMN